MAQYNQYQDNPAYNSYDGRDQNRQRFDGQRSNRNRENEFGFRNTNFVKQDYDYNKNDYQQYDQRFNTRRKSENSGQPGNSNYNRVNYIPDNDENHNYPQQNIDNRNYRSGNNYGYRGEFGQDFQARNERSSHKQQMYGNSNLGNYNNWNDHQSRYGSGGFYNFDYGDNRRYNDLNSSNLQSPKQDWQNSNLNYGNNSGNYERMNVYSTDQDYNFNRHHNQQLNNPYRGNQQYYQGGTQHIGRNFSGGEYPDNRGRMNWQPGYREDDNDRNWWDRTKEKVSSWFEGDDDNRSRRYDQSPNYRGKGPKGYARSADRIREDVCDRLTDDDRIDASGIHIDIQGRDVILTGTVHSREEKRRAEDLVESISGIENVENRLRIARQDEFGRNYTGTSDRLGGIGTESGTTNEIIRNTGNKRKDL